MTSRLLPHPPGPVEAERCRSVTVGRLLVVVAVVLGGGAGAFAVGDVLRRLLAME